MSAEEIVEAVNVTLAENVTEAAKNVTSKFSSPEGVAVAYGSLVIMALLPIYYGAIKSVHHHAKQKASGDVMETMSSKDAALFPLIASSALLGLYVVFTIFPKDYINFLLTSYFFLLGILALTHVCSPMINSFIPQSIPLRKYKAVITEEGSTTKEKEALLDFTCTTHDFISIGICSIFALWYLVKKHWIANNLLGLAFAVNGVELLQLNSFTTGALLLSGLFIYDVFWVFGTNVMVTVAKSFDAPIKLIFPQDILVNGFSADNFAMLGLGDIVIPGIFVALLLRFDRSLNRNSDTYFKVTFAAYIAGLLMTIFVMHVFKHAQPALLYLVPACLGAPSLLALVKGDMKTLIQYEDNPEQPKEEEREGELVEDKKED